MQFYTDWRSLAAFRVRIVLNLKGIATDDRAVDLKAGHQVLPEFKAINPQMALPALRLDDGAVLFQSMAIMEYLEEAYPHPPLLPSSSPQARARVRGLAQIAVADGHPLVTPRVRHYLESELVVGADAAKAWSRHWMGAALAAIEGHLVQDAMAGRYAHGDQITLADVCLVSQAVGYGYFGGKVEDFPTVARVHEECMQLDAFARAHPLQQPGAPAG